MWLCWRSSAPCVFTFAVTFSWTSSTASCKVLPNRWSSRVMFLNCETQRLKIVTSNLVWAYLDDERMTFKTKWDSALISGRKQPYHSYGALVNTCKLHQYNQELPNWRRLSRTKCPQHWSFSLTVKQGHGLHMLGVLVTLSWLYFCYRWSRSHLCTDVAEILFLVITKHIHRNQGAVDLGWKPWKGRRKEEFEGDEIRRRKTKTKKIKELNCGEKTFDLC